MFFNQLMAVLNLVIRGLKKNAGSVRIARSGVLGIEVASLTLIVSTFCTPVVCIGRA